MDYRRCHSRAAAATWPLEQGILIFDGRLYLPAASPLLPDLLESLLSTEQMANLWLLTVGFHTPPT